MPFEGARYIILADVCRALWHLHTLDPIVVHGDLKPSNIQIETLGPRPASLAFQSKVLDFGLSRVLGKTTRCLGGSKNWMAPEVIKASRDLQPDTAADVFS